MDTEVGLLEQQSLEALQHNYPQLKQLAGTLAFVAEGEATMLTATAWHFNERDETTLKQSGLKSAILDMLDALVALRKQQRIRPNREGRLTISAGDFGIEWLQEGSLPQVLLRQAG